jgi:PAS domain S-box-containing protein
MAKSRDPKRSDVNRGTPRSASDTLDELREGFQVIDFEWRYLYVNPVAARHGRYTARQLVGRTMMEAYPGIEHTPLFAAMRRSMDERITQVFENQFTFADETTRWFEIRVQPVPEGICVYSKDIERRKAAERPASTADLEAEAHVAALWSLWRSWSSGAG